MQASVMEHLGESNGFGASSTAFMMGYDSPNSIEAVPAVPTNGIETDKKTFKKPSRKVAPVAKVSNGHAEPEQDEMQSLNIDAIGHSSKSFLLIDSSERIQITENTFLSRLNIDADSRIKVVAIVGNTGDGKSHTMNHVFFDGEEVFHTSSEQTSCTMGAWAAYQPAMKVLCLDTEGFLGATCSEDQRRRMVMKILAISDIIIYRTRSERLHNDMYEFLSDSSKAFVNFFSTALQGLNLPGPTSSLGPAVVIFHETRDTKTLHSHLAESPEDIIRARMPSTDAFSSITYRGTQTNNRETDYSSLKDLLRNYLEDTTVRSPRSPKVVFDALRHLNKTFSGEIKDRPIDRFPEQYFTCGIQCESCNERCERSMGHVARGEPHRNSKKCIYRHQYENKVLMCKSCYDNGREVIVTETVSTNTESTWVGIARYAWSGSVIMCQNCGEIHRSRKYWYGNKEAEQEQTVRSDIIHIWQGSNFTAKGPTHSAQLVLDGVSYITETVANVSATPAKNIKSWVANKFRPLYWKPDEEIHQCCCCSVKFGVNDLNIHHCRGCGDGVCKNCSKSKLPVPERGWMEPVRVCDNCCKLIAKNESVLSQGDIGDSTEETVKYRKYGEVVYNTISSVGSLLEYPKGFIIDQARPSYWVPDAEAPNCNICKMVFGSPEELENISSVNLRKNAPGIDRRRHHCRSCGMAVCHSCSGQRRQVPERGWNYDVRVCDNCITEAKCKCD